MVTVEIHPECLREDLSEVSDDRIRDGILSKISILEKEPGFGKPLTRGPLHGHYRMTYGRYRILYRWSRSRDHVLIWYVGLRKEDLYALAERVARHRVGGADKR
jgi:mRNA-degrading endonuclease RelE of RelBE toxin-antitoxin system